ncbi:MAG: hypothetical protein CMG14_07085 [Candidatus Marinimicrobia bacterium]|nr:hypothetical protein [Candidatus Neomarinimicrobiota bacterium]
MIKIFHNYFAYIFFIILFSFAILDDKSLKESIDYILDGNYIYKDKYISNKNSESLYYNSIYNILSKDNPENDYLNGLIEYDGKKSNEYFENFYKVNPNNEYADDAVVKVAEYYYSSGLYIKSSEWYRKIPFEYTKSQHLDKSIAYFLNSLLIAGHKDTVSYYIGIFKDKYPKLDYSNEYLFESEMKKNSNPYKVKSKNIDKNYFSVQIGSFKNYELAKNKKKMLNGEGFLSRIEEVSVNGQIFYSVRVGLFDSLKLAKKEQVRLISRIGLYDSIIIEIK